MKTYENYISLGYFCSVASELLRIGLRKFSSPFDWITTLSFQRIIELINNNFKDFLNSDQLKLIEEDQFYFNEYYCIGFYHDFFQDKNFAEQIDAVREKFTRRIERFYSKIKSPTLFIRYINSQNEMDYIQSEYKSIISFFRRFNDENDLIFVCNDTIDTKGIQAFKVQKDEGLDHAYQFLDKNQKLKDLLCPSCSDKVNIAIEVRKENNIASKDQMNINTAFWDKEYSWEEGGDEWSVSWGSAKTQWYTSLYSRINSLLPADTVLEIAPGYGRWSQFVIPMTKNYIGVDFAQSCVDKCNQRFEKYQYAKFYKNDGKTLPMAEDGSVDFVFSYDSLVHVEWDVLKEYIKESIRILKKGGVAFLHHSNAENQPNSHNRTTSVSAELVSRFISENGGATLLQECCLFYESKCIDCITVFTNTQISGFKHKININTDFGKECQYIKTNIHPYSEIFEQLTPKNESINYCFPKESLLPREEVFHMYRYWNSLIKPVLDTIKTTHIVEIGSGNGDNTNNLLNYCREKGAHLTALDCDPGSALYDMSNSNADLFDLKIETSLDSLPKLFGYDAILIDGDHNWYTVYNELKIIENKMMKNGHFPIIFFHDVEWPYGKRDMYYEPNRIPPEFRHPYAQKGILPEQEQLAESGGMNSNMNNALEYGGPKNGVLTAIQDFVSESEFSLRLSVFPVYGGIGLLASNDALKQNKQLHEIFDMIDANATLGESMKELDFDNLKAGFHIDYLTNEVNQLNKKLAESRSELSDAHIHIIAFQDQIADLNDECNQKASNLNSEFEQERETLKAEIVTLQNRYLSLYSEHANSLNTWDTERGHLEHQIVEYHKLYLHYKDMVNQIAQSKSYKLMTPLRKIRKLFK